MMKHGLSSCMIFHGAEMLASLPVSARVTSLYGLWVGDVAVNAVNSRRGLRLHTVVSSGNQAVLWSGLSSGLIDTVATDHAPFDFKSQKPMGRDDFTKIPNGLPSLEDRISLLYTYGVKTGKIDLHTLVNAASTRAAKIFGLHPRKGAIQPGADADLVVFDPDYRGIISARTQSMNVDYSAFEGWKLEGRPSVVTVRGQIAARDGKFTGTLGRGQFLKRAPSHF